ncbi:tyrosine-type recombinase/integrase [Aminipila terrae]|uniref:Tyrosine-type recombinase/integrase n=1 Tax=Aminipila terrae TaxID=2697030 RepID=A0A6P1MI99_9FIRM|nr:tyrosine-type recombinase/integrase [Aminipila terrae]QHI73792.1 tyrosine-type recombinase/integrase [Aminipila terrae]
MDEVINKFMAGVIEKFGTDTASNLRNMLYLALDGYEICKKETSLIIPSIQENEKLIAMFLIAKKVEGCTVRTIGSYKGVLRFFLRIIGKPLLEVTTNDIRMYIAKRDIQDRVSKTTQDNDLRVLRSLYAWLTAEEYIIKNPTLRIKAIKKEKRIKKPFTEIEIEKLRRASERKRDLAVIDALLSTGMRVGEIVQLNRQDIINDECIVFGKGETERVVYFNARAVVSLNNYLQERTDNNEALFVRSRKPYNRIGESAIEDIVRKVGKTAGVNNVHPHRFRRTTATIALNRGMPIEQVQKMLGHKQIDTTMIYAQSAQENLKASHKKYVI